MVELTYINNIQLKKEVLRPQHHEIDFLAEVKGYWCSTYIQSNFIYVKIFFSVCSLKHSGRCDEHVGNLKPLKWLICFY